MSSGSRLRSSLWVLLAALALCCWTALLPAQEPVAGRGRIGSQSGTALTEKAIAAALDWLSRHQGADGSWSIEGYPKQCKDQTCTGAGHSHADMAATALGVLPFLAAAQTHTGKGPYQKTVYRGIYYLMMHQKADGNLGGDAPQPMYAHAMATIALANAYAMTTGKDRILGQRAQRAVSFIESAQNPQTGGWRYVPGDDGDTPVFGWQIAALKTAETAGLKVNPKTYQRAKKWLDSVAVGEKRGRFAYRPAQPAKVSTTAAGLMCNILLGMKPDDPAVADGAAFILENMPSKDARNSYYWYDATQAMHLVHDVRSDQWNRSLRRVLAETQVHEGCAAGSWDPDKPTKDAWGQMGGRLMVTSLSCLSLEVPYQGARVFKLDTTP